MEKELVDRINALSKLARERELTDDETRERAQLRARYIEQFRKNTVEVLKSVMLVDEDGAVTPLIKEDGDQG